LSLRYEQLKLSGRIKFIKRSHRLFTPVMLLLLYTGGRTNEKPPDLLKEEQGDIH
jgi:hypothetical protein